MKDQELLTIIDFVDNTRAALGASLPVLAIDSDWAIVRTLVHGHLVDRPLGITELISASGLTYGSGHRRVRQLIDLGQIECRAAHSGGKGVLLIPSARMLRDFRAFAQKVKMQLSRTIGTGAAPADADDYYLGNQRTRIVDISPPQALTARQGSRAGKDALKFLFHDDNYFSSLRNIWTDLRSRAGSQRDFTLLRLDQLYEALLANAALPVSAYDVVAANLPWVPELGSKQILSVVDGARVLDMSHSYHRTVWDYTSWQGQQFGIPLYATVEAFVARTDLFDLAGQPLPRTIKDLVRAAQRLHSTRRAICGIAWSGARGMPVASSFLFFLNDHGGAVVEPNRAERSQRAMPWRVVIDSPQARATLKFMHTLVRYSHPDVLEFDGDRTMYEFMAGRAAMAYVWTMRAARFEFDVLSRVKGLTVYLPHPNVSGFRRAAPVGGFMLAVPENLPPDRATIAHEAIRWLTSSSTTAQHTRHGLPLVPEFGISSDAELEATSPIVSFVDGLANQDALSTSMRPAIPVYHLIEEVLGECIHDALRGKVEDAEALARADKRITQLLRSMS